MKLEILLLILFSTLSHALPVYGRRPKSKNQLRANKEVRSIVSAIVDAILEGDRKRRSEVIDFNDDEEPHASVKSKQEIGKVKTFTKREEQDEGLRLANVIATSDVNATDDQSESFTQDITKQDIAKQNITKQDITKQDITKQDFTKQDITKQDITKQDITKQDITKQDITKQDITKQDITKKDITKEDITKQDITKKDITKQDITKQDITKQDITNKEENTKSEKEDSGIGSEMDEGSGGLDADGSTGSGDGFSDQNSNEISESGSGLTNFGSGLPESVFKMIDKDEISSSRSGLNNDYSKVFLQPKVEARSGISDNSKSSLKNDNLSQQNYEDGSGGNSDYYDDDDESEMESDDVSSSGNDSNNDIETGSGTGVDDSETTSPSNQNYDNTTNEIKDTSDQSISQNNPSENIKNIPPEYVNNNPSENVKNIAAESVNNPSENLKNIPSKSVNNLSENLKNIPSESVNNPSGNLKNMASQSVNNLSENLKNMASESVNNPLENLKNIDSESVNKPSENLKNMASESVNNPLENLKNIDSESVNKPSENLKNMASESVNNLSENLKNIPSEIVNNLSENLKNIDSEIVNKPSENLKNMASESVNNPSGNLKNMDSESLNNPSENLKNIDSESVNNPSKNLKNIASESVNNLSENFKNMASESVDNPSKNLKNMASESVNNPSENVKNMASQSVNNPSKNLKNMASESVNNPSKKFKNMASENLKNIDSENIKNLPSENIKNIPSENVSNIGNSESFSQKIEKQSISVKANDSKGSNSGIAEVTLKPSIGSATDDNSKHFILLNDSLGNSKDTGNSKTPNNQISGKTPQDEETRVEYYDEKQTADKPRDQNSQKSTNNNEEESDADDKNNGVKNIADKNIDDKNNDDKNNDVKNNDNNNDNFNNDNGNYNNNNNNEDNGDKNEENIDKNDGEKNDENIDKNEENIDKNIESENDVLGNAENDVLGNAENTDDVTDDASLNLDENTEGQIESEETNDGNDEVDEKIGTELTSTSNDAEKIGESVNNIGDNQSEFQKQWQGKAITGSYALNQESPTKSEQHDFSDTAEENKARGNYRYYAPNNGQYVSNYYSSYSNSNPDGYGDEWEQRRSLLAKKSFIPRAVEDRPIVNELVQNSFDHMPIKRDQIHRADPTIDTRTLDEDNPKIEQKKNTIFVPFVNDGNQGEKSKETGNLNLQNPLKKNPLDGLVSGDVGEPWIKDYLTKTLELAVTGQKAKPILTKDSEIDLDKNVFKQLSNLRSDDEEDDEKEDEEELNEAKNEAKDEGRNGEENRNSESVTKELDDNNKDNMPVDATKVTDSTKEKLPNNDDDYKDDDDDKDDDYDDDIGIPDDKEKDKSQMQTTEDGAAQEQPSFFKYDKINKDAPYPVTTQAPFIKDTFTTDIQEAPVMPSIHLGAGISLSKLLKHITRGQEPQVPQIPPSIHVPEQALQIPAEPPLIHAPEHVPVVATADKTAPTPTNQAPTEPAQELNKVKTPAQAPPPLKTPPPLPLPGPKAPSPPPPPPPPPPQSSGPPIAPPIPLIRIVAQPNHVSGINVLSEPKAQLTISQTTSPNNEEKGVSVRQEQGIITELNNIINNGIPNAEETLSQLELDNTVKETQLLRVIKDAIPVKSRRPSGVDNDIKEELDDLKDYASALSGIADLSPTQHDNLAKKLASDLLDDLRVADSKKEELLKQLMTFVTEMELATFRERIVEIRAQVLSFASQKSDDTTTIRNEAIRLLNELIEKLPLPKEQREEKEKRLLQSKLLNKLVEEGAKRVLRKKLRKALVDLVADKLL